MILLLLAGLSDPDLLMRTAQSRLTAPCEGRECARGPAQARFRLDGSDGDGPVSAITAKDRAIGDDGSKCNVVGARRCTKRGRTIFRTGLAR